MRFPALRTRRILTTLLLLIGAAWIVAKSSQLVFRNRAEKLFADFQTIEVGRSSATDAQALVRKWVRYGSVISNCDENLCRTSLSMIQMLPASFCGQPDGGFRNIPALMADFLGFRNEGAGFEFSTENGVVTQKGFGLDVALPVVEWYWWNHSYIPDLAVWSSEVTKFREGEHPDASDPFRIARNVSGVYGMQITFTPEETAAEQAELMHFRFSCLTQFLPCQKLGEILPEGWRILKQEHPQLQE